MKKVFVICALTLFAAAAFAQTTKKTLELPDFKGIYVNSNYTVYLKQTNKQEVVVEALTEIYTLTDIKVENGVLMINIDRKPDNPNKSLWAKIDDIKLNPTMKVYVSVKNINDLQVNGGGKIISENSIAADYMYLAVNGNGSMDVDLKGNTVKAEVSGSGTLNLKGYATSIEALVSGTGALKGFNCPLETAKAKVSGSGSCELNVSTNIDATILGSGTIKHKGNTKTATKKIYGIGTVDRAY
ncbi:MAG TPA: head GIN domain-containing protein [Ohtaekwangia sp.]|uniref:head GIN domain-containing protein n=1 Tax=Ohtaekwangia sp. TaxID=2066019 RepID=UPI002F9307B1